MHSIKISLITAVYNGEKYLKDCIESIKSQTYPHIEYIVIDGASTDGTISIINQYRDVIHHFSSAKDLGMYDALNKGIAASTGDVVGILNADDMLAGPNVIAQIVDTFQAHTIDAVYGNLNYTAADQNKVIRKWISRQFAKKDFGMGWMPAHPTLYIRRELFKRYGGYSLDFGTAADYELMLRYLYAHQIKAKYLAVLIVNMRVGGMSNANLTQRYKALINDYRAIRANKIPFPLKALLFKKLAKIPQFFA